MGTIYEELGVRTFINAAGTYTAAGGSRMSQETLNVMKGAASQFVMIREFQEKVHGEIARLTRNDAAYVSNGAATGLYLAIAAAIQIRHGKNRFCCLSRETISAYHILMFKSHRNPYDLAISHLGAEYRELGFPNIILPVTEEDLREAIDNHTAAIYYAQASWTAPGTLPLKDVIRIAGEQRIPVIVDVAAQLPPVENLWRFGEMGADVALFSGGKDLRGPQASGLMVGKKDFMEAVSNLGFPNYGIGRMMKVGREELAGLYSAIKQYVGADHQVRRNWCERQVEMVTEAFKDSLMFSPERSFPNEAGQPLPRAYLGVKDAVMDIKTLCQNLMEGNDAVYVGFDEGGIYINPMTLEPGETEHVINKLKQIEEKRLKL